MIISEFPALESGIIELESDAEYILESPIEITGPVTIRGNGAKLTVHGMNAVHVTASNVTLDNLTINGATVGVYIDNQNGVLENVTVSRCIIRGYQISAVMGGATASGCVTRKIVIESTEMEAAPGADKSGSCNDVFFAAALSGKNTEDCVLDGLKIKDCRILGPSVCNIFVLPGISMTLSEDIEFKNCELRNIVVDGCFMTGAGDTSVAIQANLINNIHCGVINAIVSNCVTDIGITGISASAGSPLKGECRESYFKGFKCIGNEVYGSDRVGERMSAINIGAGSVDYYSNAQCYDSYVCDVEIRDNRVHDCERGISVHAVYSIMDAESTARLEGNYVENVVIENNSLKDVDTCFLLMGAWIDGRRLDWHLGKTKKEQRWLPRFEDHSQVSFEVKNNVVRHLRCENNSCDGYSLCVLASGAYARGNCRLTGNRIDEDIVFRNNHFVNGEDHIAVADALLLDWVKDGGGNRVSEQFRQFTW